jgi:phospholipase A1
MPRPLSILITAALPVLAHAQANDAWQACTAVADSAQRLACFDTWAKGHPAATPAPAITPAPAPESQPAAPPVPAVVETRRGIRLTATEGCREPQFSEMTRFWELERGADCGTFGLRGYRATALDVVGANRVNKQPMSANPANSATTATDYDTTETRLTLSVRTKIAQGLFAYHGEGMDSLWLAYTQQSYWQLFNGDISRPFRSTDHEPEILYVAPIQSALPGEWRMRLGGVGFVHQSNGQSLPLSRSWNRLYLLGGFERDNMQFYARVWTRTDRNNSHDDNPDITDYMGHGDLNFRWQMDRKNLFTAMGRYAFGPNRGAVKLEWFRNLADTGIGLPSGLRLHTQIFSGYGDSLTDYNFKRTVFSVGFALVEW